MRLTIAEVPEVSGREFAATVGTRLEAKGWHGDMHVGAYSGEVRIIMKWGDVIVCPCEVGKPARVELLVWDERRLGHAEEIGAYIAAVLEAVREVRGE